MSDGTLLEYRDYEILSGENLLAGQFCKQDYRPFPRIAGEYDRIA